jgi:hypothetical protein
MLFEMRNAVRVGLDLPHHIFDHVAVAQPYALEAVKLPGKCSHYVITIW